jgi:type I restriction enzyme S subunit
MGGRRERVSPADFLTAAINLPPLHVQRRIVDLMAHLDDHLENLKAEIEAGARLEARFLERLLESAGSVQMLALGDVGEFIRGRRFTKADYVPFGLGCIHYGQVHTHFGPIATEVLTYVPAEMQSRLRLARAGDVVIAATSEDLSGLGKATAWLGDSDVAVHDDCYIFRHRLDPKYATYALASPWFQSQKTQFGDGMKVTRISSSDLAKIQIPVPPRETQIRVGEAMASLTSKSEAMRTEVASLTTLRQCLLSLLLSGQVQIPTGFDELLAEVA